MFKYKETITKYNGTKILYNINICINGFSILISFLMYIEKTCLLG